MSMTVFRIELLDGCTYDGVPRIIRKIGGFVNGACALRHPAWWWRFNAWWSASTIVITNPLELIDELHQLFLTDEEAGDGDGLFQVIVPLLLGHDRFGEPVQAALEDEVVCGVTRGNDRPTSSIHTHGQQLQRSSKFRMSVLLIPVQEEVVVLVVAIGPHRDDVHMSDALPFGKAPEAHGYVTKTPGDDTDHPHADNAGHDGIDLGQLHELLVIGKQCIHITPSEG